MEIGERLRELRIQRGLTQEELADRCELSKGFISQVERELASPSIATLKDMLECLGVTLQSFFSDDSAEKVVFAPQDMFEKRTKNPGTKLPGLCRTLRKTAWNPSCWSCRPAAKVRCFPRWKARNLAMCCADRSLWWRASAATR